MIKIILDEVASCHVTNTLLKADVSVSDVTLVTQRLRNLQYTDEGKFSVFIVFNLYLEMSVPLRLTTSQKHRVTIKINS